MRALTRIEKWLCNAGFHAWRYALAFGRCHRHCRRCPAHQVFSKESNQWETKQ